MLKTKKGFTLIELLITISIVAILSTIGLSTFIGSQKRGRDARRQSDLNQYHIALENYASGANGIYPTSASNGSVNAGTGIFNSSTSPIKQFLTGYPTDPTGVNDYFYVADATGLNFVLAGCMEASSKSYQICSNGKSGLTANDCVVPASSVCSVP